MSLLEIEAACFGVAGYVRHMSKCIGRPVHPEVLRLLRRLELERSVGGSESDTDTEQFETELIGTEEAAHILGCTTRNVRLLAKDLDGQQCGREWIFRRHVVQDYQEARKNARRTRRPHSGRGIPRRAG